MSASVHEYEPMERELFELVDWFVVLNDTARRMLVANGAPAGKLVLNRLGLSHIKVVREAAPPPCGRRKRRCDSVRRPAASVEGARASSPTPCARFLRERRFPARDPRADDRRGQPRLRGGASGAAGGAMRVSRFGPGVPDRMCRLCSRSSTCCCVRRCGSRTARRSRSKRWPSARRSSPAASAISPRSSRTASTAGWSPPEMSRRGRAR